MKAHSLHSIHRPEALGVLLLTRRSAVDVRRIALVQPRSLIVTAPEDLREQLRWKRYLARHLYRLMQDSAPMTT